MRPILDAHLDLAMNAVYYDRDVTLPLEELNDQEAGLTDQPFRGRATTTLPELRRAGVAVCLATLLARSGPKHVRQPSYRRSDLDFGLREGAALSCHAQLAYYRLLERRGLIRLIRTAAELDDHWSAYVAAGDRRETVPLGVVLTMEGADPILSPDEAGLWWEEGVRAVGITHYGFSHYGAGTGVDGPLTDAGRAILAEFERLGMALDVTHLSDTSMAEALDRFSGPVWASHHNCRALVPWDRQLTDEQIVRLAGRDAVIGVACDAVMLSPGWVRGVTRPEVVGLDALADQIDHIVQRTGGTRHVGIGTDLDGGYGNEQTPRDLRRYADLRRLEDLLAGRGYGADDLDAIFFGNWLRKLRETLPPGVPAAAGAQAEVHA
ncbi:MAG TPA: membrane dipeptidase [Planctomycetaceae bacterium]